MFSVIIISFNRPIETYESIMSLISNDKNKLIGEIIVINNASNVPYDDFLDDINALSLPYIKYVSSSINLGVAGGRNLGVKIASFEYLFFIDDDAEISSDVFSPAEKLFRDQSIFAIAFKSYNYYTKKINLNEFPHHNKKMIEKKYFDTSHFIGVAHFLRSEVFSKFGLYPEDFFYGMEEYDLSYRILKNAKRIYFDERLKVYHKKVDAGRLPAMEVTYKLSLNKITVAKKYLPTPFYISHCVAWYLRFLVKSKFSPKYSLKLILDIISIKCKRQRLSYYQVWSLFKSRHNVFY